jgi:hypothetical protein
MNGLAFRPSPAKPGFKNKTCFSIAPFTGLDLQGSLFVYGQAARDQPL